MNTHTKPDYKTLYSDILSQINTSSKEQCMSLLQSKKQLSTLDIIELNQKIFGANNESKKHNQKYKSYTKQSILKILDFQKTHRLNNTQVALHYNVSRNTIAKWKKLFLI